MTRTTPQSSARRPPGEGPASADSDEKDADWGFQQAGDERMLEPRLGIALVSCLLLAFGFVLYQKYQAVQKTALASEADNVPTAEVDEREPLIEPAVGSDEPASTFPPETETPESESTVVVTEHQSSVPDPFSHRQPIPAAPPQPRDDHRTVLAQSEPSDHYDPFAASTESEETTASSASPPMQSEPLSEEGPAGFDAPTERNPAGSSRFADADPFSGEELPPQQAEPPVLGEQSPAIVDSPPTSPSATAWDLTSDSEFVDNKSSEPELADSDSAEPDPFAAGAAPDDGTSNWGSAPTESQEPDTLESVEIAMPLAPQETEPDPFSSAAPPSSPTAQVAEPDPFASAVPLPSPATEPAEPDPFGEADVAQAPVEQPENPLSDSSDWPAIGDAETGTSGPSLLDSAPELPGLPAPPTEGFAEEEAQPDPAPPFQQSPAPVEPPVLEFPPYADETRVDSNFSMAAAPLAVIGERIVTISRNDSLWSISQDAYGTARYVPALAKYNQDHVPSPDKLRLGEHLKVPPPEVLEANFPELFRRAARRDAMVSPAGGSSFSPSQSAQSGLFLDGKGRPVYRVGKNDTLTLIAQRFLGRGSRWTEILAMNGDRLKSPETLKPGMLLRMPTKAAGAALAPDRPSSR